MDDKALSSIVCKLQKALSRFGLNITWIEDRQLWIVHNSSDNWKYDWNILHIRWYYESIHEMLFGSSYMNSIFDDTVWTDYHKQQPVIKFLKSLQSDSIEELNMKLDLYCIP